MVDDAELLNCLEECQRLDREIAAAKPQDRELKKLKEKWVKFEQFEVKVLEKWFGKEFVRKKQEERMNRAYFLAKRNVGSRFRVKGEERQKMEEMRKIVMKESDNKKEINLIID